MSHSNTPPVKKRYYWLYGPVVQGAYWQPSTTLQKSTPKRAEQNPQSISRGATYHGKLVRTFSRHQVFVKLLWKPSEDSSEKSPSLESNVTPQYNNITPPGDSHSLSLTRNQYHPPEVTSLTNLAGGHGSGLCYCKSNAWRWHNSYPCLVTVNNLLTHI